MKSNLPDDWNRFWTTCSEHDVRYHMSEWCPICEMSEEDQDAWVEAKDEEENEELQLREYDKDDYEPMDHPEW